MSMSYRCTAVHEGSGCDLAQGHLQAHHEWTYGGRRHFWPVGFNEPEPNRDVVFVDVVRYVHNNVPCFRYVPYRGLRRYELTRYEEIIDVISWGIFSKNMADFEQRE